MHEFNEFSHKNCTIETCSFILQKGKLRHRVYKLPEPPSGRWCGWELDPQSGSGVCDMILDIAQPCISNKTVLSKKETAYWVGMDVFILFFSPCSCNLWWHWHRTVWTGIEDAGDCCRRPCASKRPEWKWAELFMEGIPTVDRANGSFFFNQSSTFCARAWAIL